MTGRGHQLLHADSFAAELEALGLDASLFGAAGVPAPVFLMFAPRRANVWDANPNTFGFSDFSSAFTRASDALYRDGSGKWQTAGNDIIRPDHDANGNFLGVLLEAARTNKCVNYNANPTDLTNMSTDGDAAAVLSVVDDASALSAGKLDQVCTLGNVFKFDCTACVGNANAKVFGSVSNTNAHTVSAFWRGSGQGDVRLSGSTPSGQVLPSTYTRFTRTATPAAGTNTLIITGLPGAVVYFVLNQLEEALTPSSPMITVGASATRAADVTAFPISDWQSADIFNQGQGMAAALWIPEFSFAEIRTSGTQVQKIFDVGDNTTELIRYAITVTGVERFGIYSGVEYAWVNLVAALTADKPYLLLARWGNGTIQFGYKCAGAVTWGSTVAYAGSWTKGTDFRFPQNIASGSYDLMGPWRIRQATLWNRDAGTAFLETYAIPFANT